jgi:iron complex transport system substrate-binding protein
MDIEEIAGEIVDAAVGLHMHLGPGLLESAYELLLARELERRGLEVERQKVVPLEFNGIRIEDAFRVDLLVGGCVVVELKSVERLAPVHMKQALTYLRLMDLHLGFLINFGAFRLKDGLHRLALNYHPSRSSRSSRETKLPSPAKARGASL